MPLNFTTPAQPGDVCLLLIPSADETARLMTYQKRLQAQYGGVIDPRMHLTGQRFTPASSEAFTSQLAQFVTALSVVPAFPLYAIRLIQFYAEFKRSYVIRWEVEPTPLWEAFRVAIRTALNDLGYPPQYPPDQTGKCTALETKEKVNLLADEQEYPMYLFKAKHIWLSEIRASNQYVLIDEFNLPEPLEAGEQVRQGD